jgi:benzoate-CoA ligase
MNETLEQSSKANTLPEVFNLADYLLGHHASRAVKPAFVDENGVLTYGELLHRSRQLGASLIGSHRPMNNRPISAQNANQLRREERVLLLMHDCNDWPVSFLGAIHAGLIPVAVNTLLTAEDYAYMVRHSRAQAVLISAALVPVFKQALHLLNHDHEIRLCAISGLGTKADPESALDGIHTIRIESLYTEGAANDAQSGQTLPSQNSLSTGAAATHKDDPAFWLYSSGSTGRPKGTVHSHANAYYTAVLYGQQTLQMREDDICFSAAKLFFAYGLGNALTFPLSVGATTVLMAERPTPDAVFKRWLGQSEGQLLAQVALGRVCKPTIFFGAPTGFAGMLASPSLPSATETNLRMASSAGEALPAELGDRFTEKLGIEIIDGIGSTEMLHIFLSNIPGRVKYGTTGYPVPGYEIALRADDGGSVPDGEPGDLFIKGPTSALMYWANSEKSRATFQGEWTKSGDKYVRNADGTYTYSGRSDDMLKVSGVYVSPFEVEATLIQHPAVLEAAVIGKQDSDGLTKTKAFVVLKPGEQIDEAQLKAFVKDRIAPYKYPRFIEFVGELPKTATGKIQRFKLREREANLDACN